MAQNRGTPQRSNGRAGVLLAGILVIAFAIVGIAFAGGAFRHEDVPQAVETNQPGATQNNGQTGAYGSGNSSANTSGAYGSGPVGTQQGTDPNGNAAHGGGNGAGSAGH